MGLPIQDRRSTSHIMLEHWWQAAVCFYTHLRLGDRADVKLPASINSPCGSIHIKCTAMKSWKFEKCETLCGNPPLCETLKNPDLCTFAFYSTQKTLRTWECYFFIYFIMVGKEQVLSSDGRVDQTICERCAFKTNIRADKSLKWSTAKAKKKMFRCLLSVHCTLNTKTDVH